MSDGGWIIATILGVLAAVAVFVCAVVFTVVVVSRHVGRTTCRNWSAETGYQTKFRVLNFGDAGTCLALTPSGRWVVNSHVVVFANRDKP